MKLGLADPAALKEQSPSELPLAEGRRLYENHVARSALLGGARPSSQKRYRAVFDKFADFAATRGLAA